jgi:hypothetical protein
MKIVQQNEYKIYILQKKSKMDGSLDGWLVERLITKIVLQMAGRWQANDSWMRY